MDRLNAMQMLLAVVDAGSFSAASRKLGVPLASVSRRIAELEHHLGARLLIRTNRKLVLTDAGRDYVDTVRRIMAQVKEAELRASGEYATPMGELTIAVPSETGRVVAAPLIFEFAEHHPDITIDVRSLDRPVDLLAEGIDVSIQFGKIADESLYATKVGDLEIFTCASPAYLERKGTPAHPEDLMDHDGILYRSPDLNAWVYSVNGEEVECLPTFRGQGNNASTCMEAALRGLGIIRLFHWYVEPELKSGGLVRILDDYECASWEMYLVYVKQGRLPLKVRAFLDWMTPRLRERLKGDRL